jgi:cytochrome c-type biogenesis protein CcmH
VTTLFLLLAATMLAGALALVLRPLLRRDPGEGDAARRLEALDRALAEGVLDEAEFGRKRKALLAEQAAAPVARPALLPVLAMALLLPLGSVLVYLTIGTPQALDPTLAAASAPEGSPHGGGEGTPQMEQAIAGLEKRLEAEPENADGWMLLGRAYKTMQRFEPARDALKRAFDLQPNNPDVMVEYAEAIALAHPERDIAGEPQALLEQALADNPQHERALWLLGIGAAQVGDYTGAIARWEALLPLLDAEDAEIRTQVEAQLAEARSRAGLPAAAPATAPVPATTAAPQPAPAPAAPAALATPVAAAAAAGAPAAAAGGPSLTVEVDIAPELAAKLAPTDVLYVFARAAEGPRMPLALQRLPGAKFPLTLTLDDSMAMMPAMTLSSVPQVVVGARVSKTGVANPQSGDLEVISAPLSPATHEGTLRLVISTVVP